jgi:type VI secretion system protein VasD
VSRIKPISRLMWAALATVVLSGCLFSGPTRIKATLKADAALNPDHNGRPSPVVVRLYELKSATTFDGADIYALQQRADETLAADLVARDEMTVRPGESKKFERTLQETTKFVGVVAEFRDFEHSRWRASMPVKPKKKNKIVLTLGTNSIAIAPK